MSVFRAKSRKINENVYFQNRSAVFLNPPMRTGGLIVEKNQLIGGDLDICGNLTVGHDLHANNFYASGNYYLNNYVLIPAGTVIQSAATTEPTGWFDCDGRSLLKSAYAYLFDAIGYTYGGSGANFNIPNMQGRVGIGVGGGYALSATGGETTHTLTASEMPAHTHSLTRRGNPDGDAYDLGNDHQDESSAATTNREDLGPFNTNSTGGGTAHNNMQPYMALRYLIKY